PSSASLVLVVAALDVLGMPLSEERVHRVELVSAATGSRIGSPVDEQDLLATLLHPDGYLSRLPRAAPAGVFLNKVEDPRPRAAAEPLAPGLAPPYSFVAAGSAREDVARFWPGG